MLFDLLVSFFVGLAASPGSPPDVFSSVHSRSLRFVEALCLQGLAAAALTRGSRGDKSEKSESKSEKAESKSDKADKAAEKSAERDKLAEMRTKAGAVFVSFLSPEIGQSSSFMSRGAAVGVVASASDRRDSIVACRLLSTGGWDHSFSCQSTLLVACGLFIPCCVCPCESTQGSSLASSPSSPSHAAHMSRARAWSCKALFLSPTSVWMRHNTSN